MGRDKGKHDKKKGNNGRHNHNHHGDNSADGPSVDVAEPEKSVGDGTPDPDYPRYRVEPRELVRLKDVDPDEHEHFKDEEDCLDELQKQLKRISNLQERLYAENKQSLLIVLQAMDTGGKDGTIGGVV